MLHHSNQQQQQEGAPRAAMPQKHSKNNTDGAVFTHHERRAAGYGTQKQRLGTDSQNPFGYCCLSLKPVIDPVVRCVPACVCELGSDRVDRLITRSRVPPSTPALAYIPPHARAHTHTRSPSGHIYSRESIVEYLLTKTQELKRQKALWEVRACVCRAMHLGDKKGVGAWGMRACVCVCVRLGLGLDHPTNKPIHLRPHP